MKKIFVLLSLVLGSQLAHASKYDLKAVKGHIETNDSNIDLSLIRIEQGIQCIKGWIEPEYCGYRSTKATVDSNGDFYLKGVKGDGWHWSAGSFAVYYGDKVLFQNPYFLRTDLKGLALHKLLSNFTIFTMKPFKLNLKTDTGIDFTDWIKTENRNLGVKVNYVFDYANHANEDTLVKNPVIGAETKENNQTFSIAPQMIQGNLDHVMDNLSINFSIDSRYPGFASDSKVISAKKIKLNDVALLEKLSNASLETTAIDYTINGKWEVRPRVDFTENDGSSFSLWDPTLFLDAKCVDKVLTGTVLLFYIDSPSLIEERELTGTCGKGKAEFNLSLEAVDRDVITGASKQRKIDLDIRIFEIAGDQARMNIKVNNMDPEHQSFESPSRCARFERRGKYMDCKSN